MTMDKKLIFHHIPKSGGSSVMSSIARSLARATHARASFRKEPLFGRDFINTDRSSAFFSSHYAFHKDHFTKNSEEFLFTWIRHPITMFYSSCEFYRQENRPLTTFWPENVRSELNRLHRDRSIAHYIDSVLNGDVNREDVFPTFYFDDDWDRYDFIGICESFEPSLTALRPLVGMELPYLVTNVTKQTLRSTPAQYEQFTRGYRYDELQHYFWEQIMDYDALVEHIEDKYLCV